MLFVDIAFSFVVWLMILSSINDVEFLQFLTFLKGNDGFWLIFVFLNWEVYNIELNPKLRNGGWSDIRNVIHKR